MNQTSTIFIAIAAMMAILNWVAVARGIPWLVIGILVVSVPIVAGVVTWGSSVIAQRVRPVRMSTLALD